MNDKPKRGRGRPVGGNSFLLIRLSDLSQYLGPQGVVKVSRVWLKEIGLTIDEAEVTIPALPENDTPKEDEKKIEFSLTTFED